MRAYVLLSMILAASLPQGILAQNLRSSSFRAGAAKVDVTPSEKELPKNWHGILDRLYSRAIVLDNGASRAALITVDDGAVSDATWRTVTERVEKELGIPASNVLLTATHTHSALRQRDARLSAKNIRIREARAEESGTRAPRLRHGGLLH